MAQQILSTKLFVPPGQPRAVARPRLIERLNGGLHRKLTLVSAPAGFGKTTLVSEWIAQSIRPTAWLSLDEGDSDPTRFFTYLIAALQTVESDLGDAALGMFRTPQAPPAETILTVLINDIASRSTPITLVLDDYHAIESEAVQEGVSFLLEHLPPQIHLVITTREDPPLPLPRLRARAELTELRAEDLCFTSAEVSEFLSRTMGLNLTAGDIATLESRTEGWIAGLQLAALSMQQRDDLPGFIRSLAGDNRYILDYLVDEVLQRQPEHTRRFLLETSMLDQLNGPLCDAVTGRSDGKEMIATLERENLFVVPLDDRRNWFRYHHLFADVLRMYATEAEPDEVLIRHDRASEWYQRRGLPGEAIRHALIGGNDASAADLIEREALGMLMTRQDETLHGWLGALPDATVQTRPVLGVYYALAMVSVDLEIAERRLREIELALDIPSDLGAVPDNPPAGLTVSDHAGYRALPGIMGIVRAYRGGALGDIASVQKYARRALEVLPEDAYLWRGAAAALLGLAKWNHGALEDAANAFTEGIEMLRMSSDTTQSISGAFILGNIRVAQGRLHEAERIYQRWLKLAEERGRLLPPSATDLYIGLSELSRERGDLDAAARYLRSGEEQSEHGGTSEHRHRWYIAGAAIEASKGNLDRAVDLLDEADRVYLPSPDPNDRPVAALRARIWIRQGRLADAVTWAHEQGLSIDDDLSYPREFEHITLARLLIARYCQEEDPRSIQQAESLLARLLHEAKEGGRVGSQIEILVLQSLVHQTRGDADRALATLHQALTLAEPEGYVRVFVDEGTSIARLLAAIADRSGMSAHIARLTEAFEAAGVSINIELEPPRDQRAQSLVEPLSERELEVLRLVARGLSNREIGERLFLALNTVKGHNRVIFSKLQVERRTEAVARAHELGLLHDQHSD